jgi:hypothetical protein
MCIPQSQQGPNSRTQTINIQVCGTTCHMPCNSGGMQPPVCAIPGISASDTHTNHSRPPTKIPPFRPSHKPQKHMWQAKTCTIHLQLLVAGAASGEGEGGRAGARVRGRAKAGPTTWAATAGTRTTDRTVHPHPHCQPTYCPLFLLAVSQ